jgi:hypothetical protein
LFGLFGLLGLLGLFGLFDSTAFSFAMNFPTKAKKFGYLTLSAEHFETDLMSKNECHGQKGAAMSGIWANFHT